MKPALIPIALWLVDAMTSWVHPIHPAVDRPRYQAMAQDIVDVVYADDVRPVFGGPRGRALTALELAAIGSYESQYRADVDDGRVRGKLGEVCFLQVQLPPGVGIVVQADGFYTYEHDAGWRYPDLLADRQKCIRAALAKVRESYKRCGNLSLFTAGPPCRTDEPAARYRHGRAVGWWRHAPAPLDDAGLLATAL